MVSQQLGLPGRYRGLLSSTLRRSCWVVPRFVFDTRLSRLLLFAFVTDFDLVVCSPVVEASVVADLVCALVVGDWVDDG